MVNKDLIWVEKYRPKLICDLVLEESTRNIFIKFLNEQSLPHLLLFGSVGCGKTTIAKILISSLDCDSIIINASSERGIDIIRSKIKQFAMMSSLKKWKIVFLDEADGTTPEFLFALRNLMETFAEQTRFILTANYINKIIEPIRSRCQLIEFNHLGKKQIRILLEKILNSESIEFDVDDLLILIDLYYPDIRSMINNLQLYSDKGKWKVKNSEGFRNFEQLLEYIKKGDLKSIRELNLDYTESYKYLFDKVDNITDDYEKRVNMSLDIADYMYKDVFISDKSINFAACVMKLMERLK